MIAAVALVAVLAGGSAVDIDPLALGAPEVQAVASPTVLKLGGRFTLVVTATYGAGVEVNLPNPLVLGDAFEAGKAAPADKVRSDGRRVREWYIPVYAWDVGDLQVPPIDVTFTAGGKAATIATNPIPIRVAGALGDADDPKLMRAMTPPVPLWRRDWFTATLYGFAIALAILIATVLFLGRRKRKQKAKLAAAPPVRFAEAPIAEAASQQDGGDLAPVEEEHRDATPPPAPPVVVPKAEPIVKARRRLDRLAEETLARLRALEQSGRLDSDRKGAYREMVDIIRDYLGARFDVDARELTTRELCQALGFRSIEAAGLTRAWLADCDLVKYANRTASGGEARAVLDGACWLVDRTTPGAERAEAARA